VQDYTGPRGWPRARRQCCGDSVSKRLAKHAPSTVPGNAKGARTFHVLAASPAHEPPNVPSARSPKSAPTRRRRQGRAWFCAGVVALGALFARTRRINLLNRQSAAKATSRASDPALAPTAVSCGPKTAAAQPSLRIQGCDPCRRACCCSPKADGNNRALIAPKRADTRRVITHNERRDCRQPLQQAHQHRASSLASACCPKRRAV